MFLRKMLTDSTKTGRPYPSLQKTEAKQADLMISILLYQSMELKNTQNRDLSNSLRDSAFVFKVIV